MTHLNPFHLAIPVHDLESCLRFYQEAFHCEIGRRSDRWVDLNLMGHQVVLHLDDGHKARLEDCVHTSVDEKQVPVPHFGVVLPMEDWHTLVRHLKALDTTFLIEPCVRFQGKVGEQATLFFQDPSGNVLEFKAFSDINQVFAS